MRPYGGTRHRTPQADFEKAVQDKGSERLHTRLALQKALGPVPPSVTAKSRPPCTCEDCASDPVFAAYARELEQEEHSHLDEVP